MELAISAPGKTEAAGAVAVSDAFAQEYNQDLVHQIVTAYLAGARQGTRAQKNRAAVSGGGKKPWRQKGTGRARAGTIRSPIWRGGGITFAAQPQDHSQKVNKKMYRAALRSIFSELARQDRLVLVEEFTLAESKTKLMVAALADLGLTRALIVAEDVTEGLYLAARNLHGVSVVDAAGIDPVSLVGSDKVVITVSSLKKIEELLA